MQKRIHRNSWEEEQKETQAKLFGTNTISAKVGTLLTAQEYVWKARITKSGEERGGMRRIFVSIALLFFRSSPTTDRLEQARENSKERKSPFGFTFDY